MSTFMHQPSPNLASTSDVILHAFDWPYRKVTSEAKYIAQLGYDSVLISPSMTTPNLGEWWNRYQPQDYRVIDSPLGNTSDFKAMVHALSQEGIRVYVDVVFNHMANEAHFRSDLTYPNADTMARYQNNADYYESLRIFGDLSVPLFTDKDFEPVFPIKDWLNTEEVQSGRLSSSDADPGLPTLALTDNVIDQQQAYLRSLKKLGVKGFRIDAAKHMSLAHIQKVWTDDIRQGVKIFGEIITSGNKDELDVKSGNKPHSDSTVGEEEYTLFLEPFLENTSFGAYNFPLFHRLSSVFKHDHSMRTLLNLEEKTQYIDANLAVTFAVTHDIPNNDIFRSEILSPQQEQLVYCYLLGCDDGSPLIYTDLNTSNDLDSLGNPRWEQSWHDNHLIKMIRFHKRVHKQPMHILECSDDVLVILRGTIDKPIGVVAINKGANEQQISLPPYPLEVWLGGDDLLRQELTLPAQSGVMLMA